MHTCHFIVNSENIPLLKFAVSYTASLPESVCGLQSDHMMGCWHLFVEAVSIVNDVSVLWVFCFPSNAGVQSLLSPHSPRFHQLRVRFGLQYLACAWHKPNLSIKCLLYSGRWCSAYLSTWDMTHLADATHFVVMKYQFRKLHVWYSDLMLTCLSVQITEHMSETGIHNVLWEIMV